MQSNISWVFRSNWNVFVTRCELPYFEIRQAISLPESQNHQKVLKVLNHDSKITFDGTFYFFLDKCLAFGTSVSCKIFQEFSNSAAHTLQWKIGPGRNLINCLDDYIFGALLRLVCKPSNEDFLVSLSPEKTFKACTQLTFSGFFWLTPYIRLFVSLVRKFLRWLIW